MSTGEGMREVELRLDPAVLAPRAEALELAVQAFDAYESARQMFGLDPLTDAAECDELLGHCSEVYAENADLTMALTDLSLQMVAALLGTGHLVLHLPDGADTAAVGRAVGKLAGSALRQLLFTLAVLDWAPTDDEYRSSDPDARAFHLRFTVPEGPGGD